MGPLEARYPAHPLTARANHEHAQAPVLQLKPQVCLEFGVIPRRLCPARPVACSSGADVSLHSPCRANFLAVSCSVLGAAGIQYMGALSAESRSHQHQQDLVAVKDWHCWLGGRAGWLSHYVCSVQMHATAPLQGTMRNTE